MRRGYIAVAVMCVAFGLTMLSMVSPMISTSTDFSIFNTGWNGTSRLAVSTYSLGKFTPSFELRSTGGDAEIIRLGLDEVTIDPSSDVLAIIGPTEPFTASDGSIIGGFVRAGGRLLLADDFGSGNGLLEAMGSSSRFSGKLIIDLSFEKTPEFPICFDLVADQLTENISALQLNYATSLTLGEEAEPLARTSVASWLDTDGDRLQDFGEPKGPFVVAARERLGLGEAVLLADPSLLINGMQQYLDNEGFSSNLIAVLSEGRSGFLFDESHRDYFDLIAITAEATGSIPGNAKAVILFLSFFLAVWIATDVIDRMWSWVNRNVARILGLLVKIIFRRGRKRPLPKDEGVDDVILALIEAHPEWRSGLVKFVVSEKRRHDRYLDSQKPIGSR